MHRVKQRRGHLAILALVAATFALAFALPALAASEYQLSITTNGTGTGTVKCSVEEGPVGACAAEYPEGTELTLIPEAGPSSEFIEFSGDCGPLACELLMDEAHTAIATFDLEPGAVEYPLTITKAGTGTGTVQCEVESGPIGSCAAEYPEGTELSVLAEADLGSKFAGFSGACTGSSCDLTMSAAKSVTATFNLEAASEFALTVTKAGTGTGTVLCEAEEGPEACKPKYPEDTEVTLLPTADSGSSFAGFSGACTGPTCTLTMDAAKSVTATFNLNAPTEFTLTVNKTGTGTGTVQCKVGAGSPGACAAKYPSGTSLTLIATANGDSEFAGYSAGTGSIGCTGTGDCSFTLTANSSVTATFNLKPVTEFTLTVNKTGTGTGTVQCKVGAGSPGACAAKYPSGTSLTLIATANGDSEFAGYSAGTGSIGCTGTGDCSFTLTANSSVTATFNLKPVTEFTLTVNKTGTGTGTVQCKVGAGSPGACAAKYPSGTSLTLIATANGDSEFAGYSAGTGSIGCTGTGDCSFTLTANSSVTATFNLKPVTEFTLTVNKTGTGTGTVQCKVGAGSPGACAAKYPSGTSLTLIATANGDSEFAGYSAGTGSIGCTGTGDCSFTLTANSSVTATFNLKPVTEFTLTVNKTGTGTGTVQCKVGAGSPGACAAKYPSGTSLTLIATANGDSEFAGYSAGTGSIGCTGTGDCSFTLTANSSVTATFNLKPVTEFTLTVNKTGTGTGTVQCKVGAGSPGACAAKYPSGTSLTLIATANGDSTFAGWSGGGCSGTGNCALTMSAAKSVTATFNTEFTLTVNKAGTGTGTVQCKVGAGSAGACAATYPSGTALTLIATPNGDSEFAGWSGSGCSGTGNCALTMSAAKSVTATFKLKPVAVEYALAIEKIGTGSGTVTSSPAGIDCGSVCEEDFADETNVTLTATADAGSAFDHWTGSGCNKGTCVVEMSRARTIKAVFDAVGQRTLTVTKAGTGTGTVTSAPKGIDCGSTCTADFDVGKKITLIAAEGEGSTFTGFSGACTGIAPCHVTMSEARSVTATFDDSSSPGQSVGLVVVAGTAKVKNGKALLRVFCNGPSVCKGELKLGLRVSAGEGQGKRTVVIGKASFDLQPGASTVLRIKLTRRALSQLAGRKAIAARVGGTGIHPHAVRLKNA